LTRVLPAFLFSKKLGALMSYHSERRSAAIHRSEARSLTLSGEGVDDLLLDSLLSLRKSLVFTDGHLECSGQHAEPWTVRGGIQWCSSRLGKA
jgi:hypothetical protein